MKINGRDLCYESSDYYPRHTTTIKTDALIEEMGDGFRWIKRKGSGESRKWLAQSREHPGPDLRALGDTPYEAVRNLKAKRDQLLADNE